MYYHIIKNKSTWLNIGTSDLKRKMNRVLYSIPYRALILKMQFYYRLILVICCKSKYLIQCKVVFYAILHKRLFKSNGLEVEYINYHR